jgi:uncharacterized membrane-anchored protein YitT (DUF2179 family)
MYANLGWWKMKKKTFVLTTIPALGSLVVINLVEPYVLGLPFVLFWAICWVFLTSLFLIIANKFDPSNEEEEEL